MTPAYRVVAGDEDITERLRRFLDEIRVTSSSDSESDTLELAVSDDIDSMIGVPGEARELHVFLGYGERLAPMGIYYRADVDIELVPRRLVVRATAADLRSRSSLKEPRDRAWSEVTLGSLVADVAAAHGYAARVDPSLADSSIAHIDQVSESDLHLLRRVVGHYDATVKAVSGHLVVVRRGSARSAGTGVPLPVTTVTAPQTGRRQASPAVSRCGGGRATARCGPASTTRRRPPSSMCKRRPGAHLCHSESAPGRAPGCSRRRGQVARATSPDRHSRDDRTRRPGASVLSLKYTPQYVPPRR